jgi:hypothetical protein
LQHFRYKLSQKRKISFLYIQDNHFRNQRLEVRYMTAIGNNPFISGPGATSASNEAPTAQNVSGSSPYSLAALNSGADQVRFGGLGSTNSSGSGPDTSLTATQGRIGEGFTDPAFHAYVAAMQS